MSRTPEASVHREDPDPNRPSLPNNNNKFHFSIDRGGTFTDVYCRLPDGSVAVRKLLSEDPAHYPDAPTEGIRRLLEEFDDTTASSSSRSYARGAPIDCSAIGSIRMGTTVATNALLERQGARTALVCTTGFRDALYIGTQARPDIFDLTCARPSLLYESVVEVHERVVLEHFATHNELYQSHRRATGTTGEPVIVLQELNLVQVRTDLERLMKQGITSLAVCLLHAYLYPDHERQIGQVARELGGFDQISLSHEVMPMIKWVSRAHTACAAAYLTPQITHYLAGFVKGFADLSGVPLVFMKSDGGLAPVGDFGGHQAILSGPAAGVVGYAKTAYQPSKDGASARPVIGFDMGGTSTDVSRYAGTLDLVLETTTAGIVVQAPQLDIHTVAAGGGSRLFLQRGLFVVGPESARAHPGPVCYRKNGYLAVTDANVVLGRVVPQHFPKIFGPNEDEALDVDGARQAFDRLMSEHPQEAAGRTVEELAYGFLQVANEAMCRPIRNLTTMKGYDIANHVLACFGGAGPQHACAMAKALGMSRVFVHRYGGILSAYGLSLADAAHEEQEPAAETWTGHISESGQDRLQKLQERAVQALERQGYAPDAVVVDRYLNMRYHGTDTAIMIREDPSQSFEDLFVGQYQREFGFVLTDRDIRIDDYRVRAVVPGESPPESEPPASKGAAPPMDTTRAYFEGGWQTVPVYDVKDLEPGHEISGPSIIVQPISTIVLEEACRALVTANGDLDITVGNSQNLKGETAEDADIHEDPVQLSIFAHRFMGIAEQMGRTLQRTAISVNMKERLDFSCALFTKDGGLVANAPHVPIHLGALEWNL